MVSKMPKFLRFNSGESLDKTAALPAQPSESHSEKRIAAFRAANLAVVALFEQGLDANSHQVMEANEYAESVLAGRTDS